MSNYMKCIMGVFSESLGVRFKKVKNNFYSQDTRRILFICNKFITF